MSSAGGPVPAVLRQVRKEFGDVVALDSVTISVRPGIITGLIGPNGSGKTTMLRLMAGLSRPTAGSIEVLGHDPRQPASRLALGVALAAPAAPHGATGHEVVRYLSRLGGRSATDRAAELADRFELDLRRIASHLSKGNQQKLALVVALMHRPAFVLLDEPTAGLDPVVQGRFREVLVEERNRGTAVLLSSHVLSEVRTLADHLVAIRAGRIVADVPMAKALEATRQPVSLRVRSIEPVRLAGIADAVAESEGSGVWRVDGFLQGSPNDLVRLLAGFDLLELTIGEPRLSDLIETLYEDVEVAR